MTEYIYSLNGVVITKADQRDVGQGAKGVQCFRSEPGGWSGANPPKKSGVS
jgi:hypothetical protein